jgi:hypothetical protein
MLNRGAGQWTTANPRALRRGASRRGTLRAAMIGVLSLILLPGLVVEGRSVLLFHTTTPWSSSAPPRIHVCGREYNRAGVVSASVAKDGVDAPLQQLGDGPLWQPVFGHPADPQLRAQIGGPCAMVLYMREGSGYRSFVLSGGP